MPPTADTAPQRLAPLRRRFIYTPVQELATDTADVGELLVRIETLQNSLRKPQAVAETEALIGTAPSP